MKLAPVKKKLCVCFSFLLNSIAALRSLFIGTVTIMMKLLLYNRSYYTIVSLDRAAVYEMKRKDSARPDISDWMIRLDDKEESMSMAIMCLLSASGIHVCVCLLTPTP